MKEINVGEVLLKEEALLTKKRNILSYICRGSAVFTLESTKLRCHRTYHIIKDKKFAQTDNNIKRFRVYCLFGQDNDPTNNIKKDKKNWRYIGLFYNTDYMLILNRFTIMHIDLPVSIAMIKSLLSIISDNSKDWPRGCKFHKSEFCAVCGRRLTTPESVEAGIGPKCIKRIK